MESNVYTPPFPEKEVARLAVAGHLLTQVAYDAAGPVEKAGAYPTTVQLVIALPGLPVWLWDYYRDATGLPVGKNHEFLQVMPGAGAIVLLGSLATALQDGEAVRL